MTLTARDTLGRALDWHDAHADLDAAVGDLPPGLRGTVPDELPYSAWQLLEHLRIAQHDILEFCVAPTYHEIQWPDDYWPQSPAPPDAAAWDRSVEQIHADITRLQQLARDPAVDLDAGVPNGTGQTYLRELLLVIDHNAYHLGQLVLVRRLLGAWQG
jgi:uncharacterized damage-inducible protein DinB